MEEPPILMFANNQITIPTGAATLTALPNTNKVLSKSDLTITFPIWGFLYGGSSNIKEEGTPFNTVFDNIFDIINVKNIPSNTTNKTQKVEIIEDVIPVK